MSSTAFRAGRCDGVAGSQMTATRVSPGTVPLSNSRLLAIVSLMTMVSPVALVPGRARLATWPLPIGSAWRGRSLGRPGVDGRRSDDEIDLKPDEFLHQAGEPVESPFGPAVFDDDVLPLDPAQIAQPLTERFQRMRPHGRGIPQKPDAIDLPRMPLDGERRRKTLRARMTASPISRMGTSMEEDGWRESSRTPRREPAPRCRSTPSRRGRPRHRLQACRRDGVQTTRLSLPRGRREELNHETGMTVTEALS